MSGDTGDAEDAFTGDELDTAVGAAAAPSASRHRRCQCRSNDCRHTGTDALTGQLGNDTLLAGDGVDRLIGGGGNDILDGDRLSPGGTRVFGLDTADYSGALEGIAVNLGAGQVVGGTSVGTDTLDGVEVIIGTDFADTLDASSFSFNSANNGGDGFIIAGGIGPIGNFNELEGVGATIRITGNGNTRISYATATPRLSSICRPERRSAARHRHRHDARRHQRRPWVEPERHHHWIRQRPAARLGVRAETLEGRGGDDFLDGNGGFDRVRYDRQALSGLGVDVQLAAGVVTGRDVAATAVVGTDTLRSIESVRGSNSADTYNAVGFAFNSTNGGGSDQGNFNEFEGMAGDDVVVGNGNTRVAYYNASVGVTITMTGFNAGTATGNASVGTDTFTGVNQVLGSTKNDTLLGSNNGTNYFEQFDGWAGDDLIDGGLGLDRALYNSSYGIANSAGVTLTTGMFFDMDLGIATGRNADATTAFGTDTLRGSRSHSWHALRRSL